MITFFRGGFGQLYQDYYTLVVILDNFLDSFHINPLTFSQWVTFFGGKFVYFITHFYIPCQFMPLTSVVSYLVTSSIVRNKIFIVIMIIFETIY